MLQPAGEAEDCRATVALDLRRVVTVLGVAIAHGADLVVDALDETSNLSLALLGLGSEGAPAGVGVGHSGVGRGGTVRGPVWSMLLVAAVDAPYFPAVVARLEEGDAAWLDHVYE